MRETLTKKLPAGAHEGIVKDLGMNNEDPDEDAVDTKMMATYIETQMEDKKDLLELVVEKANRSVSVKESGGAKEGEKVGSEDDGDDAEAEVDDKKNRLVAYRV
jgi:hypothetical protein